MNKKGIIFDLDGTTLNTSLDLTAAANYALKTNGYDEVSAETVIGFTGNGTLKLMERLLPNLSKQEVEKIHKDFEKYYNEHPYDLSVPYEGVIDTLKELKSKNYKLCILSNKDDDLVQQIIDHFFPGIFDFVTGAQYGIPLKPDPTLTYLAMTSVGLETDDMVFVGDTTVDYETAQNIRMTSIILSCGFMKKETLIERGIPVIIGKFEDLLKFL